MKLENPAIRKLSRFLFLTFLKSIALSYCFPDIDDRYTLINSLTRIPCSISNDSPALLNPSTHFTQTTSQEITFATWMQPQGVLSYFHTIFSIHEIGTLNLILDISYNPSTNNIRVLLKSNPVYYFPYSSGYYWTFIRIRFELATTAGNLDIIDFEQGQHPPYPAPPTLITTITFPSVAGSINVLNKNNILINYGYSSPLISQFPACAIIKLIVLYFNTQPTVDSSAGANHTKSSFSANILSHFDSNYAMNNLRTYMNYYPYQQRFTSAYFSSTPQIEVVKTRTVTMHRYPLLENVGLILYFEFQILSAPSNQFSICNFSHEGSQFVKVAVSPALELQFIDASATNYVSIPILPLKWYQVAVILNSMYGNTGTFISMSSGTIAMVPFRQDMIQLRYATIGWGDTTNTMNTIVNNIRVYQGSLVGETNDCYVETKGDTENHCLFCKTGKMLSYNDKMKCVPSSGTQTVDQVADWTRPVCPADMIYMYQGTTCTCQYSQYISGGSCVNCPTFCKGCTSPTNCIQKDINRNSSTGLCVGNFFDDGYTCLPRSFKISNLGIFLKTHLGGINSQNLDNTKLGLSGSDTFFFQFFMSAAYVSLASYDVTFGYFRDNGLDIFLLSQKFDFVTSKRSICFEILGTSEKCYFMHPLRSTSIGVWFSFTKVIFTLRVFGTYLYETFPVPASVSSYFVPEICAGECTSFNLAKERFRGGQPTDFMKFIRGVTDPSSNMEDFYKVQQRESEVFGRFMIYKQTTSTDQYESESDGPSFGSTFKWVVDFHKIDLFKGTSSDASSSESYFLNIPPNQIYNPSISMSLLIEGLNQDRQLMTFSVDSQTIYINLVPENVQQLAYIRICYSVNCIQTKYCSLPYKEPNFVAFFSRIEEFFDGGQSSLEIEVVCNYKKETLKWEETQAISNIYLSKIKFPSDSNTIPIYINNVRIIKGSDVYFDYQDASIEKCFLFIGVAKRQCIHVKKGFAIFKHKAITIDDCNNTIDSTLTNMVVYNPYTNECQDTRIFIPRCKYLDVTDTLCKECIDSNANPKNNCECFPGFYLDAITDKCTQCHVKCSTCSEYGTCDSCKFPNTSIPYCNCNIPGQYQETDYSCQDCESQCGTCEIASDNCLTCSINRVEAPLCQCDSQFFSPSWTNCEPYNCSYQCDSCEYSERNCVVCSYKRSEPPLCNCEQNYFEQNKTCFSCPTHQYFNKDLNKCMECAFQCLSCADTRYTCTECLPELFLYKSTCVCSDLSSFKKTSSGDIVCNEGMNVTVEGKSKNNKFNIILTFDTEVLVEIDFSQIDINELIYIYFSQIPDNSFTIENSRIENGNQIVMDIVFSTTFRYLGGILQFIRRDEFQSNSENKMLDIKYLTETFTFQLSTIIISDSEWSSNEGIEYITDLVDNSNFWFDFIQQMQFCFYVLNTLQQTVIFLLVDIQIPPNLYQPLQFIGKFAFNVQNYGETKEKSDYKIMEKQIDLQKDYTLNQNGIFKRIDYSGALIVNLKIALFFFFLWPIVIFFLLHLVKVYQNGLGQYDSKLVSKLVPFAYSRVQSGLEGSLLVFSISASNQFQNIDEQAWLNRISCYCAVLVIVIIIYFNYQNCQSMIRQCDQKGKTFQDESALALLEKLDFEKGKSKTILYYFGQVIKKYFIAIAIVFFQDIPSVICLIGVCLQVGSFVMTILMNPYKKKINNVIKAIGELCIFAIWVIYFFIFVNFTSQSSIEAQISENDIQRFLAYGTVSLALVSIYNGLYLIDLIYSKVIVRIIALRKPNANEQAIDPKSSSKQDVTFYFSKQQEQQQLQAILNRNQRP